MAQSAARKPGAPRRAATVAVTERAANEDPLPLYAAALFKISMELKRPDARDLELVLDQVLDGLNVDPSEFRAYLARNLSLLKATARAVS
jgi:hypothetical protein